MLWVRGDKDLVKTAEWYRKAAEQDITEVQNKLGVMYAFGDGVTEDVVEAYKWVLLASRQIQKVNDSKEFLASKMNLSQITKAQNLAKVFADQKQSDKQ